MRLTLVILYFAAVYYILRPAPPANLQVFDPSPPPIPEDHRHIVPTAETTQRTPIRQAPLRPIPSSFQDALDISSDITDTESLAEEQSDPAPDDAEAGEQRTSTSATPDLVPRNEAVERGIQKELARLACYIGKPEKGWGRKTRAAVRRFMERAEAKSGNPDAALLRLMRAYPADYCRLCSPGEAECRPTEAFAAPVIGNDHDAPPSYLPPWLTREKLAKAQDEVQSDATETAAPPKRKKKVQRRRPSRSAKSVKRRRAPAGREVRRQRFPNVSGWPSGR